MLFIIVFTNKNIVYRQRKIQTTLSKTLILWFIFMVIFMIILIICYSSLFFRIFL